LMNGLAAVNPFLFRALDLKPGQRVLDLGSGTGDPALALAQWVGPRGRVLGIDNSEAMLAVARRRARILGLRNLTFRRGDMMRLARRGLLAALFRRAGLRDVREAAAPVAAVYSSVEDLAQIQLESALAETCAALGPAARERLRSRLVTRFRRFQSGPVVRVPAHAWVVSGRR